MIHENGEIHQQVFPYFQYLWRDSVVFQDNIYSNKLMSTIIPKCSLVSSKKVLRPSKTEIFPKKKTGQFIGIQISSSFFKRNLNLS
jgi:hypothetical protein